MLPSHFCYHCLWLILSQSLMHLSLSHTDPTPPQVREAANLAKEVCRSTIQSCRFVVPSHLHGHRHWSSALTFGTSRQSTSSSIQIHSAKKLSQKLEVPPSILPSLNQPSQSTISFFYFLFFSCLGIQYDSSVLLVIVQEVIHSMKNKNGQSGWIAIKVD